jgi:hypothetical protein
MLRRLNIVSADFVYAKNILYTATSVLLTYEFVGSDTDSSNSLKQTLSSEADGDTWSQEILRV